MHVKLKTIIALTKFKGVPLEDFQEALSQKSLVAITIKVQTISFTKPEDGHVNVKKRS